MVVLGTRKLIAGFQKHDAVHRPWRVCSTGFGECLNDEPIHNLAYQYQFSDYPPTIDRRRSVQLYEKGPVYQKLPGNAYTADEQCAQTFEHETRRCPYMVSCLLIICCLNAAIHHSVFTLKMLRESLPQHSVSRSYCYCFIP